jgi:hypothetical protein
MQIKDVRNGCNRKVRYLEASSLGQRSLRENA